MRRCYSRVKVSYGMQNLSIQQERYDNIFIALTEVANIVVDDEKSYKIILDWIGLKKQ